MISILGYGAYLPTYRLGSDSGIGSTRVVASFDEDATTMATEVGRQLATQGPIDQLHLATTSPPYADKTNAAAVHAALGLDGSVFAADFVGSPRSTFAALRAANAVGGLVLAADVRIGRPGSADERSGADAAAGVLLGEGEGIAEVLGHAAATEELLDRWRLPTALTSESWEERFGFERYRLLLQDVASRVLDAAGLKEADHVVLTSPNLAVSKRAGSLVRGAKSSSGTTVGFSGAADPLVALASVLDRAEPGETVLLLSAADGADALLLRATEALPERRQPVTVAEQLAGGREVPYPTYLGWRGLLDRELPRRPEPDRPAAPPSSRGEGWKFAFNGSRCACGFAHLPPMRVCRHCGALDEMETLPAADLVGTVATFTVDRLAYSPSPPVINAVIDLDGGGRCVLEVADADPDEVEVGVRVGVGFRRLFTAGNVHNYFWKAKVLP